MIVEYIWIDGSHPTQKLRSKTRVLEGREDWIPTEDGVGDLPEWGFDGSSTSQATGEKSDCVLKPVFACRDPLRVGPRWGDITFLVLCEVFTSNGKPHPSNSRAKLRETLGIESHLWSVHQAKRAPEAEDDLFGLEQEYTLFQGSRPLGFEGSRRFPAPQGPYYCGVGADEAFGRKLVEDHLQACLYAGLKISGINAEVMPGQWEFQVGPLDALSVGDHLWLARWLLYRIGEDHGINATLDAKPVPGDWNGAGCHSNFSTLKMRIDPKEGDPSTGMAAIEAWCEEAGKRIEEHLKVYGDGIEMRLTGRHETCSYRQFKYGVSDRTASIRIPLGTAEAGFGYLEDRRPNANICPYQVAEVISKTAHRLW